MNGTLIKINTINGKAIDVYVSIPETRHGPGLLLLPDTNFTVDYLYEIADLFAEEGYVVAAPKFYLNINSTKTQHKRQPAMKENAKTLGAYKTDQGIKDLMSPTISYLCQMNEYSGMLATLGFGFGGTLSYLTAAHFDVDVCIAFYAPDMEDILGKSDDISCPVQLHFAGLDHKVTEESITEIKSYFKTQEDVEIYLYPNVGASFYDNSKKDCYNRPASMMSHSRTIAILHKIVGPNFDLEALWENHIKFEFQTRDTADTLATMVGEPYVNHVPTMTGGTGFDELRRFYKNHFIPQLPKDTHLIPISRTVGSDRVVDEMIFCFTHDEEIDWMLPGIPPTGKNVEIPLIAIVNFRGGKLYNEHIYWDQASVLVQIGKLDPENLPIAGLETAQKVKDVSLPSNTLMSRWANSAPKLDTQS